VKKALALLLVISIALVVYLPFSLKTSALESKVEDTIINFYDTSYNAWLDVEYYDLSNYLYTDSIQSYNKITSFKECISRWECTIEDGYNDCRAKNPISFGFGDIVNNQDGSVTITVDVSGDNTKVYPYFVYFGENTYTLVYDEGIWKISEHLHDSLWLDEYPATSKVEYAEVKAIDDYESGNIISTTQTSLVEPPDASVNAYPYTSYPYSASRAVTYANYFWNRYNDYFYNEEDENCTNFVSQCISYGFGDTTSYTSATSYMMHNNNSYSNGWFAGSGGGSGPWENVSAHWNYMLSSKSNSNGPRATQITYSSLGTGDVMQIDFDNDGTYDHTVICINGTSQEFAQHSYQDIRYYSDYSGTKRFYRPTSFRQY